MNEWLDDLSDIAAAGDAAVIVTVAGVRGSAPREIGAKMLVTRDETVGTIGGGQLEHQCTRIAAGLLGTDEPASLRSFPLGAALGQCCGGVVEMLFEPIDAQIPTWLNDLRALHGQRVPAVLVTAVGERGAKAIVTADDTRGSESLPVAVSESARKLLLERDAAVRTADWFLEPIIGSSFNIAVFGAGHVGTAVVAALSQIDCNIRWIDSRRDIFRGAAKNVRMIEAESPPLEVAAMPDRSYYLVMTHSHALDFEICDRVLRRRDAAYCGLIGSRSKRRRFEKRYRQQGMPQELIDTLVCPIGVSGISGKKPAEIAVAVAAELLRKKDRARASRTESWPDNVRPLTR